MVDRPILFSAPMVKALLDGRKSQTRRIVKRAPWGPNNYTADDFRLAEGGALQMQDIFGGEWRNVPLRFAVGDRLYVREHWRTHFQHDGTKPRDLLTNTQPIIYMADETEVRFAKSRGKARRAMHMPRWASRLTLNVTEVRVQRLQEISPEDARDEGVDRRSQSVREMWLFGATAEERAAIYLQACTWEYQQLWNALHGDYAWETNPWIVAVTFTVEKRNIDA